MTPRRHVQHLFSDYIDGSLSPGQAARVEAHLAGCPACARELAEWRAVLRLVATHAPVRCPIDCASAVIEQIAARDGHAANSGRRVAAGRHGIPLIAAWSVALVPVLAVAGALLWRIGEVMRLHGAPGPQIVAVAGSEAAASHAGLPILLRSPKDAVTPARMTTGQPPSVSTTALKATTPDRVDEAFSHSDSLILAADFAEDDR
jgi:anti-sigma factor RsiW